MKSVRNKLLVFGYIGLSVGVVCYLMLQVIVQVTSLPNSALKGADLPKYGEIDETQFNFEKPFLPLVNFQNF